MTNFRLLGRAPLWRQTALAAALSMSLAGVALAQSNASGTIFGRADASAGGSVRLENVDTGQTRDISIDQAGRYRAASLPVGRYKVSLMKDGKIVDSRDNVAVQVGTGTDVSFAAAAAAEGAKNLEGVSVVASALPAIDVSSVDSRTVLTSETLQKIPVARNITAAALLAPGTVQGDSRYGNVASFGGASAAENQYYVNGYAVTNSLTGIGMSQLPFDAIDQQQVLTGGYGAEFGRSTGGVVNIITKRGTNQWKAGAQVLWIPNGTMASPRNLIQPSDNTLYQYRNNNKYWSTEYGAYISGPLVKDKLFFYATGDFIKRDGRVTAGAPDKAGNTTVNDYDIKTSRWLTKIDWNITDNHIVEFTAFGDKTNESDQISQFNNVTTATGAKLGTIALKNYDGGAGAAPGGDFYIGKYTGYITDDLTVTALYGESRSDHVQNPVSASGQACPIANGTYKNAAGQVVGPPHCYLIGTLLAPGAVDKTKGGRLDVEYRVAGHDIRVGIDNQTLKSYSGTSYEDNQRYTYHVAPASGKIASRGIQFPAGTLSYVDARVFKAAANVKVEQEAQYIEDHWQVSDRWLAYLGLRNEQFSNYNGAGETYARQRHQLAPRLGVTWDAFGDSSLKIYANAGRYHLAVPANVAIRGASASLYSSQYGTFTGIDPVTGAPIGFQAYGPTVYLNNANNTTPDPRTVAAKGLGAYYQDEYILGFDKQLSTDWTFGGKVIYRNLKNIIDDMCDSRPFLAYAKQNNIDMSKAVLNGCYLFNPGKSNTFLVDVSGKGDFREFKLSKDDLKFPDLKRKYIALDLYLEHQFNQQWFGKVEYVLSHNFGNSEGMLKSDIGQRDPSVTQDWDAPELMRGANGPLPNDRRHQIKAYGWYQMNPDWLFGANLAIASGRPKNCIGVLPGDPIQYGEAYFYCDGQIAPRGSRGRTPWTYQLDLSTQWSPSWANHQLAFTLDVFNVFNSQKVLSRVDGGETDVGVPDPAYNRPISFQTPRYFRLGARYDFSL